MKPEDSFILVGCSGFRDPSWRGPFYPLSAEAGDMLGRYAKSFLTVEVNGTFYGYLRPAAFERWLEAVPNGFLFSLKAPRLLTEHGPGEVLDASWRGLLGMVEPLRRAGAFGALLIQTPAAMECDLDWLEALLEAPGREEMDLAFEFKHSSWFQDRVMDLLAKGGADAAAVNRPGPEPFLEVIAKHKYFRLNGLKREGTYDYTFTQLEEIGEHVRQAREKAERVYVYFNNPGKGCAPGNAKALARRILKL